MAHVITRTCQTCLDHACVDACPVDCIVQEKPGAGLGLPAQLFIDPEQCISCGSCEVPCPVDAIYDEDDVPEEFADDVALNARTAAEPHSFEVPPRKR